MNIQITARNFELSSELKDYINEKLKKIKEHFPEIIDIDIILQKEKYRDKAEITIHAMHQRMYSEEITKDMYQSISMAIEKMDKNIRKFKTKIQTKKKKVPEQRIFGEHQIVHQESVGEGTEKHKIVSTEALVVKPMSPDDAIMDLELNGKAFHIFLNVETNQFNVVYRLIDGNYGLIIPKM
ncbi:MAG: ribosome-associated translation inhibitor RaiA [Candidatus Coatesbacteria bacterium]|nr:ribosome-associated translation inhibitor RaiA [Candidatus Coatesbacteria bacterium]